MCYKFRWENESNYEGILYASYWESALGSFWWQAVQGVCWSATYLPSVSESYHLCLQVEWGQASLVRLGPLWGLWPIGYVSSFLKRTAEVLAPRLSVVFRRLVRLGSFPAWWRQPNVTPIPKGQPSFFVANYRPISITSVLSKVFEGLVSVRLGRFMERSGVLPTTQFTYRKGLGTCDALLSLSHTLQSALKSGQEVRILQIDLGAAFDRVNHQEFCISFVLWLLEVLYCLYRHSFYQLDQSTLWLTVVGVNWLTSCQKCRRAVFWAHYCSSYTPRSFFPFCQISWSVIRWLHFDSRCAIPRP